MLGVVLALCYSATFGLNSVISRRGVIRANANYVATISIFSGPIFFLVAALIAGELLRLGEYPWQAYVYFAISGVIHFALGRTFGYRSLQLIGATRANVVTGLYAIVSVIQAVIILNEVLTPMVALGIVLSLSGPILMALKEETVAVTPKIGAALYGKHVDRPT
ncbi:MAG: DMT family transporter, partial [Dehalococcoidia bacterium]|nr:DMT family transporter [Dehalococcoidia bacterium]